jgi:arylsulfate sulfotransferase
MTKRSTVLGLWVVVLAFAIFTLGCGGPNGTATLISINPSTGAVSAGATLQFGPEFQGGLPGNSPSVTWSVNGVVGGSASTGTISNNGLYQAPQQVSGTATFTVQGSVASGGSASASVSVFAPGQVSNTQNPLVALYSFGAPAGGSVQVEFGPDTNYGLRTWSQPAPSGGGAVSILVAGMRANTTYHLRATAQLSDGSQFTDSDRTFATGALPSGLAPSISVTTTPGMTPNSGIEMLDLVDLPPVTAMDLVATDLSGNVVWYYIGGPAGTVANPVKLLPDGNLLIDYSGGGPVNGWNSLLEEVDLAGNVIWQMSATDLNQALAVAGYQLTIVGTHHDFAVLPNGHLLLIASTVQNFSNLTGVTGTTAVTGDVVIDLDATRKPVWVWSEFDHLDVNRHPMQFPDWTHTNTIFYSSDDGDIVISLRHQHWVIKIDYQDGKGSGDIVWKLGWQGDFTLQGGTDPVDWFYAQHDVGLNSSNSSGTFQILLFDNGDNRVLDASGDVCGSASQPPCYSTVPIIQVDETAKTATILSRDNLAPVYSFFGGSADTLPNGNLEFDECAPTANPPSAAIFETTQGSSPQTVWEMQIANQYAYRGFRLPSLYPGVQW